MLTFKVFTLKKLTIAIFHLGFIVIIIGAGITRFYGVDGLMSIRENQEKDYFLSQKTFVNVGFYENDNLYKNSFPVEFNYLSKNKFEKKIKFNNKEFKINLKKIIPNAVEQIVSDKNGIPILYFTYVEGSQTKEFYIKSGEKKEMLQNSFSFNSDIKSDLNINYIDNKLNLSSKYQIFYSSMKDSTKGFCKPDSVFELKSNYLYRWNNSTLILNSFFPSARIDLKSSKNKNLDALYFEISNEKEKKEIIVFGKQNIEGELKYLTLNNNKISIDYGANKIILPFTIKLNDFELTRYLGSKSPSSYKSNVLLKDSQNNFQENFEIYMNHVLNYDGYKFFQSSYDDDEQGTILSVNKDYWGSLFTYIGYTLLFIGMFLTLFNKNSRLRYLMKKINEINFKSFLLIIVTTLLTTNLFSQNNIPKINKAHAEKFGELYVLDFGGRIKPVNTLTSEILRKLTHRTTFNDLTSDQFYLSLILFPDDWAKVPLIKVTDPNIIKEFKIKGKHMSLNELYKNDVYKLQMMFINYKML